LNAAEIQKRLRRQAHKSRRALGQSALKTVSSLATLLLALAMTDCGSSSGAKKPDKLTQELLSTPKETLFEKGKAAIAKKKYDEGRKYLNFVFETYPNDALGRQALLMVADSYFRQGGTSGYTEARFRYRDYLNRYPGAPQRDYARYQFALCYDKEHEKPDRDQTSTREAIEQYRSLMREFPDSIYVSQARERIRRLGDLLAEHEFSVGYFYMRKGATGAALGRFTALEERFPEYSGRDKLFFYSAHVLKQLGRDQEAERYLARLLAEYPDSEYAKKVRGKNGRSKAPVSASVDTKAKN
jgi:outer membrane protein assembly factor BamD